MVSRMVWVPWYSASRSARAGDGQDGVELDLELVRLGVVQYPEVGEVTVHVDGVDRVVTKDVDPCEGRRMPPDQAAAQQGWRRIFLTWRSVRTLMTALLAG